MKAVDKTKAISDLAAAELPALLAADGLADFDVYQNKSPLRVDDKEFCVYIDLDDNLTDARNFGVIIQAQIYGLDQVQEYHSVIMPWLEENMLPSLVDAQVRESLSADVWPMDTENSVAYIYYTLLFSSELDDCDF